MNRQPCPKAELARILDEPSENSVDQNLLMHLDECEHCRRALEEVAASAEDWGAVAEALTDDGEAQDEDKRSGSSQADPRLQDSHLVWQWLGPSDDPRYCGRIGLFEVVGMVGSGGMGIVLKAHDPALDRFVAIKLLAPHLASSQSARRRFAREARAAAAVIHENVIPIYQVSQWRDLPYLVMPYMPDPSLGSRLDSEGALDLESVLTIGWQIAAGLDAAHAQGLVHRDVKPANVLLGEGTERAIITDFGLARTADDASLTSAGALAGTPHYMSPEQARGLPIDHKTDLFSLGSVLFAMLTGLPPVDSELASETIDSIARGHVRKVHDLNADVPEWLSNLVDWLHYRDPANRPESAAQVAKLLQECLAHVRQPNQYSIPQALRVSQTESPPQTLSWSLVMLLTVTLSGLSIWSGAHHQTVTGTEAVDAGKYLARAAPAGEESAELTGGPRTTGQSASLPQSQAALNAAISSSDGGVIQGESWWSGEAVRDAREQINALEQGMDDWRSRWERQ